ncbi:translocation protein TolB [Fulvivirgaceae bacterium BMA12]|uniref:Translocation protein TolB n=1 Tax=Agaribacillus aureus TaxID=3051825 RepID=A0ABT8LHN6_9BACT|nr:translocation protein TolB [Fulvivirgaceae bacterium BMA12]
MLTLIFPMAKLSAQETIGSFGKNRIQYKIFDWKFYSSDNFDVYFYDGGNNLAKMAASFLEGEFDRLTDVLGYQPYSKTKIFLYNSVSDLQQSNVGVNENIFTIGGQTNFVKSQVEIAYPGTISSFKEELLYSISKMLINDMMFGGSITDMFQSGLLLSLPDWFLDGAAAYISKGWSVEMDDQIRDLFGARKFKKLSRISGNESTLVGQSLWNYIAENYGRSNISYILNLTRIIRDEEKGIANTLSVPFKRFLADWQQYYAEIAATVNNNYTAAKAEAKLQKRNRKELLYSQVSLSPGSNYLAYAQNNDGKYKVIIKDTNTGKERTALIGGYKVINQEVDHEIPVLSWKDDHTLGIINVKAGKSYLWLYDINTKRKFKKELGRFNQIKEFDFSTNGNLLVLSADIKGKSDIFIISLRRNGLKRVTNDIYDDVSPKFIPNSKSIVFSSNRTSDTIDVKFNDYKVLGDNYNLFIYNLDTTRNVLYRATNTLSKDFKPIPKDPNTIYYLSDQKGIVNLYKYTVDKNLFTQVSNFNYSIQDYDIDFEQQNLSFVMINKGKDFVYMDKSFDFDKNIFTPQTRRQEVLQARFITNRLNKFKLSQQQNEEEDPQPELEVIDENTIIEEVEADIEDETDIIDTDNYVFDKDVVEQKQESNNTSFLSNYRKLQKESKVVGPLPYETRFSADNLITSWVIDPMRGFGIQLEARMNDMLENHRFYGGILAITDLKNNDLFAEYQFLKYKIDFGARYERKTISRSADDDSNIRQRYTLNKVELSASYPLSVTSRLSFKPFYALTRSFDLNDALLIPGNPLVPIDTEANYAGGTVEFVFDNSSVKGLNLYEGTRGKASFTHYQSLNEDRRPSFSKLSIDLRNYQKIHKEFVFATRLFYGRYFGSNSPKFLLGGMDNWLFKKADSQEGNDPLAIVSEQDNSNLLFVDYVTNLRGFNYNKFNGSNAILFNAELRLPIVKYLSHGPISSNFLRNLQFIGFYDIGSSWNGDRLWPDENSLNRELIQPEDSPFEALIDNFNSPWLSSYGVGVRTVFLGYYMKFDVAWPIEDYEVKSTKFYVTLGYDF